jgi:hypothetical protein
VWQLLSQEANSLPYRKAVLQQKTAKLIDHSCPITDQARSHTMQRLQIQLTIGLYRNAACRGALYSFRDRVRISEVVLMPLTERLGIGRRHLFDLVTERK